MSPDEFRPSQSWNISLTAMQKPPSELQPAKYAIKIQYLEQL